MQKKVIKIEMALLNDLRSQDETINQDANKLSALENDYFSLKNQLNSLISNLKNKVNSQGRSIAKMESELQKLGLEDKVVFALKKSLNDVQSYISDIEKKL